MSSGKQQMLAIAQSLPRPETDLLVLDKSCGGLTRQILENGKEIIRDLNDNGVTSLLVEQNAEMTLKLAEHAYVLGTDKVAHDSPAAEWLSDRTAMETYFEVK